MAKRRKQNNPLLTSIDMFSAGMQMADLMINSGKVITHRSDMILRAMEGKLPFHHREFTTMWLEKCFAGSESMITAMKYMGKHQVLTPQILMHIMAPYHKKAKSNARRLARKEAP